LTTLPKRSILPINAGQIFPCSITPQTPILHGTVFATSAKTGGLYLSRHPKGENFDFSAMVTKIPANLTAFDDILN
jgi:hypothetical protein